MAWTLTVVREGKEHHMGAEAPYPSCDAPCLY